MPKMLNAVLNYLKNIDFSSSKFLVSSWEIFRCLSLNGPSGIVRFHICSGFFKNVLRFLIIHRVFHKYMSPRRDVINLL